MLLTLLGVCQFEFDGQMIVTKHERLLGDFLKRLSHVARMERSGIRGVRRGTWISLRFIQATQKRDILFEKSP